MGNKIEWLNQFHTGDCEVLLDKLIEDKQEVDLVLTSPPYNTTSVGDYYLSESARLSNSGRYDIYMEDKSDEEYIEWCIRLFNKIDKVLKTDSVILFNISYSTEKPSLMWLLIAELIKETNFNVVDTIYWKKKSAMPNNMSHNRLTRTVEPVFVFSRKGEEKTFKMNKRVVSARDTGQVMYENLFNFIDAKNNDGSTDLNKATFSSELVYELLDMYSTKGNIVLDPFMGTGTTAIGCLRQNRGSNKKLKYIGFELSENQVLHSINRVSLFKNKKQGLWGKL